MRKVLAIILIIFLTSCSSYVNRIHRDMDRSSAAENPPKKHAVFQQYRDNKNSISTKSKKSFMPGVRRQYQDPSAMKKRVTEKDLNDTKNEASLWAGNGKASDLFTINKDYSSGDIVLINVMQSLKEEIGAELKRAFPERKVAEEKKEDGNKDKTAAKPAPPAEPAKTEPEQTGDDKIQDRISGIILEEINKDHILIRGRKNLLFNNKKRLVEVQALVSRKDIGANDTVDSNNFLETSITVLR